MASHRNLSATLTPSSRKGAFISRLVPESKSEQSSGESSRLEPRASAPSAIAGQPPPAPEPHPASFLRDPSDAIPRLESYRFHSALLPEPEHRALLVYLPREYFQNPDKRFPVLYLHDGQNLFDGRTSFLPGHPWFAHTTADQLTAERR
ncbi:MAG TPA: hypothetical protein VH250_05640, partial [Granulicella sp.]|nr:hypothetical protein [Granulicella sp.]